MESAIVLIIYGFFVFIIVMVILLNFVEKDRIPLMGDFFTKVLPRLPWASIFAAKNKKSEDPN